MVVLPSPVGPGHQQDAVGPREQRVEALQRVGFETHLLEAEAHARTIQHPHHDAFAVDGGHGRNAQVQFAALDPDLDAAVLRQAPLRNVEVRQQLDARADRSAVLGRHDLRRMNDAIDAVAHMKTVVERLEVNVGSAKLDHPPDDGVDQPDHRRLAGEIFQVLDEITRVVQADGHRLIRLHLFGGRL